jgi:phage tail sheath protein FI
MSTLTITSPGVQINEVDLSIIARPIGSTDVLVTGFAPQGPTEEIVNVGSVSEFESVFGTPTNGAERYLYYTAKQILSQSPANLLVSRMPYGSGAGEGYANTYSALVYPFESNTTSTAGITGVTSITIAEGEYGVGYMVAPDVVITGGTLTGVHPAIPATAHAVLSGDQVVSIVIDNHGSGYEIAPDVQLVGGEYSVPAVIGAVNLNVVSYEGGYGSFETATNYKLGSPVSVLLSDDQYNDIITNNITWNSTPTPSEITGFNDIGNAGLVVVNTSKTAINDLYEGFYVAIADNQNHNPATAFTAVQNISAVVGQNGDVQSFVQVPTTRLSFTLSQQASAFGKDSLSKVVENYPVGYDFSSPSFNDSLVVVLFNLKSTRYGQDTIILDYAVSEAYAGSLNANRTQNNIYGGTPVSYFLDNVVNTKSNNLKVITNPYISSTGTWTDSQGLPAKTVRVNDDAKNAYSSGAYTNVTGLNNNKDIGQVDQKLARLLTILSNDDTTNIDVIADAGLSTIWSTAYARSKDGRFAQDGTFTFDETYTPYDIDYDTGLANTSVNLLPSGDTFVGYEAILQQFVAFAEARKDHVFVSDPLRQIFVRGQNGKRSSRKTFVFSEQIYWPLNNLYSNVQSSYVTTYGNWIQSNDVFTSSPVWLPASGYASAVIAKSSQQSYPWIAPAGFNRGTLNNVLDLGVNPTQKQRDLLYKINVNPIAYFNQDGFVIYGQKTMYRKPSAFDRINVRRLFLTLEKEAQRLLKYYVFEPNDFATRNRLKGALIPIFDQAKLNDGCYDYLLVCDTTNNTPDVIDNNELKISIYIQPVRAAEFILADFIATRTGVNFSELIAGGQ